MFSAPPRASIFDARRYMVMGLILSDTGLRPAPGALLRFASGIQGVLRLMAERSI
jgi:hypothetical protein